MEERPDLFTPITEEEYEACRAKENYHFRDGSNMWFRIDLLLNPTDNDILVQDCETDECCRLTEKGRLMLAGPDWQDEFTQKLEEQQKLAS